MAGYPWGGMESPFEQPKFGSACRIDVRTTSYILGFDPDTHILGLTRRSKWDKNCCNTMLDASKSAKLHQIMYKAKDGTKFQNADCNSSLQIESNTGKWTSPLGFMPPLSKPSLFPGLGSEPPWIWFHKCGSAGFQNSRTGAYWNPEMVPHGPTTEKIWKNLQGDPTGGVHNKAVGKHVSMRLDLQQPIVWYQKDPKGLNTVTYRSEVIWVGPSYLQQKEEPGHVIIDFKATMLPKSIRVHADPW